MTPALVSEMLADRLNGIEAALAQVRLGQPSAVQELRHHLLDILTLVERDPGLDAAADDLHRAARAIVEIEQTDPGARARHDRLLGDARRRLLVRLEMAGFELMARDLREP
ncbi:hypothetical protein [Methylobacterium symbioticum]|uniref:hypothetical protein n=1 Tax=Methylobacterium symbioticum TaxID=2584084 RepID=UPI001157EB6D|nr:hypothetical protein [Methylobacterium symbioticum]